MLEGFALKKEGFALKQAVLFEPNYLSSLIIPLLQPAQHMTEQDCSCQSLNFPLICVE